MKRSVCLFLYLLMFSYIYNLNAASIQLTLRVVDEMGNPVPDANVWFAFFQFKHQNKKISTKGKTNAEGLFTGRGDTDTDIICTIRKKDYYETKYVYKCYKHGKATNGKWQPWSPTVKVVLKRMINPVPMYAKLVSIKIPEENKPIGFDLECGDWVAPYGKGNVSDFVFESARNIVDDKNYTATLNLSFTNKGDGIQSIPLSFKREGSKFRSPHVAPETGYISKWRREYGQVPGKGYINLDEDKHGYAFRVKTELNGKGEVMSAEYGKIMDGIRLYGYKADKMTVSFNYFLNPDGTRNLEFDPERNLFKNLTSLEKPNMP